MLLVSGVMQVWCLESAARSTVVCPPPVSIVRCSFLTIFARYSITNGATAKLVGPGLKSRPVYFTTSLATSSEAKCRSGCSVMRRSAISCACIGLSSFELLFNLSVFGQYCRRHSRKSKLRRCRSLSSQPYSFPGMRLKFSSPCQLRSDYSGYRPVVISPGRVSIETVDDLESNCCGLEKMHFHRRHGAQSRAHLQNPFRQEIAGNPHGADVRSGSPWAYAPDWIMLGGGK